jgi:hypothetical protein
VIALLSEFKIFFAASQPQRISEQVAIANRNFEGTNVRNMIRFLTLLKSWLSGVLAILLRHEVETMNENNECLVAD